MKKNKGFTLIEILVVIGIIAILAAVVLIAINPARQFAQARDSQRVSAVNTILNAVGQYIADNKGNLPSGITLIQSDVSSSTCYALTSTYVAALPTDPKGDFNGTALSTTTGTGFQCGDIGTKKVGYEIYQDTGGRITVVAVKAELASTTVTR